MLGNVSEWCFDVYLPQPNSDEPFLVPGYKVFGRYATRGNNYSSISRMIRSANRRSYLVTQFSFSRGFRIARTVKTE